MKTHLTLTLRIALAVVLVLLAGLSALQMIPPRVVPADAPAARFSAERAMADLQVVAREPHSAGSDAQARVREYIVGQVEALGLNAEIETSGQVSNILVFLPGTESTGTVLVTGHYDSQPPAPGAGDDGISVVAMLESMRVLRARQPLRNDILFLFTDGEELGWKGAQAFIAAHPEARSEVGVLLVFDALPGNAPLNLLETSPGDGWLVRQMTGLPLSMWAASWKSIQERKETDTDFDTFQPAGYTGIAIENEATGTRYHDDRDTVDAISPNLVQAYGQTMLALTDRFGSIDLRTRMKGPDIAFFTLSLVGLVAYPYWVMLVLSSLGILALLAFVILAWRLKRFSPGRFGLSLVGLLLGILLIVLCAKFAWGAIKTNHAAEIASYGGFEGSASWQAGFMVADCLLMIGILTILARRLGGINLAPASAILFLIAGFGFNTLTHNDNPLTTAWVAWSFIGCVAGVGVLLFTKDPIWKVVFLAFSALLTLAVAIPRIWMAIFTREDAWLMALVVCVWVALFAPQVDAIFGRALVTDKSDQDRSRR